LIVFINGAFGIGKSTVARHLRTRLGGRAIFDPEPLGVFLQHVAQWFPLNGAGTDDFQDLSAWRQRLTGRAAEDGTIVNAWAIRRAAECCQVHQSRAFGLPVKAGCRSPESLADDIAALVDDSNVFWLHKTPIV